MFLAPDGLNLPSPDLENYCKYLELMTCFLSADTDETCKLVIELTPGAMTVYTDSESAQIAIKSVQTILVFLNIVGKFFGLSRHNQESRHEVYNYVKKIGCKY